MSSVADVPFRRILYYSFSLGIFSFGKVVGVFNMVAAMYLLYLIETQIISEKVKADFPFGLILFRYLQFPLEVLIDYRRDRMDFLCIGD